MKKVKNKSMEIRAITVIVTKNSMNFHKNQINNKTVLMIEWSLKSINNNCPNRKVIKSNGYKTVTSNR